MSLALLAVVLVPLGYAGPYGTHPATARSEARQVASFDALDTGGPFDVEVTVGGKTAVTVTCDADLVSRITSTVSGSTLRLRVADHQRFEPRGPCKVQVTAPHLGSLTLAGSGDVAVHGEATGLSMLTLAGSGDLAIDAAKADSLSINLAGSGDVHVAGAVQSLQVRIAGSGDVDLSEVPAARASVAIQGSGDVTLAVRERLDATIAGSGDVVVHGHPEVHQHIAGSGEIRLR